jgi:predicted amidophosphoribosyltransferase
VRRSRKAAIAASEESPSRPRGASPVAPSGVKACPTCREEFPRLAEFCPNDGNRLVSQTSLGAGPGGSVCPVCGRGFNPGTSVCPEHGEELVPAAVFAAQPKPALTSTLVIAITRTICPLCGKQYSIETRFCGDCGAAVVPIN